MKSLKDLAFKFMELEFIEEVKRKIEITEGELDEACDRAASVRDAMVRSSLESVVARKEQALKDLREKLSSVESK